MRAIGVICLIAGLTGALSLANAADPDPFANVSVKSSLSGGSVYMLSGGGNIDGYIAEVAQILGESHDMLKATVSNTKACLDACESIDGIVAKGLGPQWASFAAGFITEEQWIRTVQAGLQQTPDGTPARRR